MADCVCMCGDTLADAPAPVTEIVGATSAPYCLCYLGGPALVGAQGLAPVQAALPAVFEALGCLPMEVLLPAPPNVRHRLQQHNLAAPDNLRLIEPLDYAAMQAALSGAALVISDSPTVQRESYLRGAIALGLAPADCPEGEHSGWVRPVAMDTASILRAAKSPPPAQPPDIEAHRGAGLRAAQFLTSL